MSNTEAIMTHQIVENKARPSLFQGWTFGDMLFAAASFILATMVTLWLALTGTNMLWCIAAYALAAIFSSQLPGTHYARLYHELWVWWKSLLIRVVLRDVLWAADPDRTELVLWARSHGLTVPDDATTDELVELTGRTPRSERSFRQWLRDRRYLLREEDRLVLPLSIEFVEARGQRAGVLNQLDSNLGHLYVIADGSLYNGLDATAQESAHAKLSAAINRFVARSPLQVGVSQLRLTRPADLTKMMTMLRESGDPFMMRADVFELDEEAASWVEWRQQNLTDLGQESGLFGASDNWMMMVVTFQWTDEWKRASRGKISEEQIHELPLIELGRSLVEELLKVDEMGIQNPRILSPVELAHFIKCAFKVVGIESFHLACATGGVPTSDDELLVTSETVELEPDRYSPGDIGQLKPMQFVWPSEDIEVKHDRIRVDDTWFMIIREIQVSEIERTDSAQLVHSVMPIGTFDSFAAVSQKTSGEIEARKNMFVETLRRSKADAYDRNKIVQHPKSRRQQRAREEYLEQISVNSINQRYHRIRVLTAATSAGLDRQYRDLRAGVSVLGVRLRPVTGRARLIDALITGLLGANRL
jgi:hypothetical protein